MVQVNPELVPRLEREGLKFVGRDESGRRMEVGGKGVLPLWCVLSTEH